MKDKILAFLVSKAGGVITPLIAAGVAALVSKLAMIDPKLAESVDQVSLTGFVVAFIVSIVNYLTNEAQVKGVKKIQALVNTDVDGVFSHFTKDVPLRRLATPDEISGICSYLGSDDSSFMTGAVLVIDGGTAVVDVSGAAVGEISNRIKGG